MSDYDEFEFLHHCATKIQKQFRGFMARQFYQQIKQLIYYHYQEKQDNIGYDMCFTEENDEYGFLQYKKEYLTQPSEADNYPLPQQNYYEQTAAKQKQNHHSQRKTSKQESYIYKENISKIESQVKPLRKRSKQTISQESKINHRNQMNEQDQVVFLTDVVPSSHDSLIDAYKENMMFMEDFKMKKTHNISNISCRSELSVKIHQMSTKQTLSNNMSQRRNQILSPTNRHDIGSSPKKRPIVFDFDIFLNAALLIQKVYRGYISRKRQKHAVLILESHLTAFLRKQMHQRRMMVKQMSVLSYNIQNQCRSLVKVRDQVTKQAKSNQKLHQNVAQTNQLLYDSFLQLLSPDYQHKSQKQKLSYIENMKNYIFSPQPNNASIQDLINQNKSSQDAYNKLSIKYMALKKTHKSYLENFIAQMKDVNQSQNPNMSSIDKQSHSSSKSSILSENNQNYGNQQKKLNLTTKQFHSLLMKQQLKKKIT